MGGFERAPATRGIARDDAGTPGVPSASSGPGPGKQTLTAQLGVQRSSSPQGSHGSDGHAIQDAAAQGVAGGSGPLPHGDAIQRLFGRHDVSGVEAHVGGAAATASRAIGAEAYATGHRVAFASAPSLHTAAHEAAHVVQQRGGVQLKGGVGESGDAHEQHANAVADAVVQGRSAEGLLDRYAGGASGGGGAVRSGGHPVQCFGSQEHQSLGDTATGTAHYEVGGAANDSFQLSHGDIVALSGDYFLAGPGTTAAGGRGQQDDLFYLAGRAGNRGQAPGTRDEVIWTLKLIRGNDARFASGGPWASYVFSDAVKAAVNERYQRLAAANTTHFAAPRGRDASGQPSASPEGSAGSSYRSTHEAALRMAFQAGQRHEPIDRAMAMEAAAQHYLTDSFSAGHVRTPIGDLREYWGTKYPLFWYNLRHKMALDTAVRLNAQSNNLTTALGTVNQMYNAISQQIEGMAASLPAVTLGDLLAKVFHDRDNAEGVDIQGGGRIWGDDNLDNPDPRNQTRALAQAAVRDGNADVQTAHRLGGQAAAGSTTPDDQMLAQVRTATATGTRYLAETRMPVPATSEAPQNWRAGSLDELWGRPVVGTTGPSVGAKVIEALQPGHEIRQTLEELADRFPETDSHLSGDLRPRRAYRDGFLAPLVADPHAGLLHIINWAPNYGLASNSRDDQSLASGQELDRAHQLGGMTTTARVAYINELLDGYTADDEGALVVRIFQTAPSGERRAMYRQIEGHDWTGEFRHGAFVSDDKLWNSLSRAQLDQLRGIING
jgi:hypothetical protein